MPETTPEHFRFLPEYLIEDITEFLSFVSKWALASHIFRNPSLTRCISDTPRKY